MKGSFIFLLLCTYLHHCFAIAGPHKRFRQGSVNQKPPRRVCLLMAGKSHVDLLLNSFLGLYRFSTCDIYPVIPLDDQAAAVLSAAGFQTLPTDTPMLEAKARINATNDKCATYLFAPMLLRSYYTLKYIKKGYDVVDMDVDMFPLKNMVERAPPSGVLLGAAEGPSPPDDYWYYAHTSDGAASTLGAGFMLFMGSNPNMTHFYENFYEHHVVPNMCELGFLQTRLNAFVRKHLNVTFRVNPNDANYAESDDMDGIRLKCFFNQLMTDTFEVYRRARVGVVDPIAVHAVGGGDAGQRASFLKNHNAWILRDDWSRILNPETAVDMTGLDYRNRLAKLAELISNRTLYV